MSALTDYHARLAATREVWREAAAHELAQFHATRYADSFARYEQCQKASAAIEVALMFLQSMGHHGGDPRVEWKP